MNVIQHLAIAISAHQRCIESKNPHASVWEAKIAHLMADAPSGSGFDSGTSLGEFKSLRRITFHTSFHHMNDGGLYDGWTEHEVHVEPEFDGFSIRVTGRDRNGIKEYISECFHHWLSTKDNGVETKNADGVWVPCFGAAFCDGWEAPNGCFYRWE